MKIPQRRCLVSVTWHDAHDLSSVGWHDGFEFDKSPCVVTTVGHLLPNVKPDHVVVAGSITADGQVGHVIAVPVAMVRAVRVL